jgi:26S proteasome non-ATPase regulatory subunit 9
MYLVDQIFDTSPAQTSGLKTGDQVLKFGSMVKGNHSMQLLSDLVKDNVGKPIEVILFRNPEGLIKVRLTPKTWSGPGLLGCHLTPIKS